MINSCKDCDLNHPKTAKQHENTWLCMRFQRFGSHPVTGLPNEPYWRCLKVREIANDIAGNCEFFEMKRNADDGGLG